MSASPKQEKNLDAELEAVQTIVAALDRFDYSGRFRILRAAEALMQPDQPRPGGPPTPPMMHPRQTP